MSTPSPEHPIYEPSPLDKIQAILTAMLKAAAIAALLMYTLLVGRGCLPHPDNTLPGDGQYPDNTLPEAPVAPDNTLPEQQPKPEQLPVEPEAEPKK